MAKFTQNSDGSWKKEASSKKNYTVVDGKKVEQSTVKTPSATSSQTWDKDIVTLEEAKQQTVDVQKGVINVNTGSTSLELIEPKETISLEEAKAQTATSNTERALASSPQVQTTNLINDKGEVVGSQTVTTSLPSIIVGRDVKSTSQTNPITSTETRLQAGYTLEPSQPTISQSTNNSNVVETFSNLYNSKVGQLSEFEKNLGTSLMQELKDKQEISKTNVDKVLDYLESKKVGTKLNNFTSNVKNSTTYQKAVSNPLIQADKKIVESITGKSEDSTAKDASSSFAYAVTGGRYGENSNVVDFDEYKTKGLTDYMHNTANTIVEKSDKKISQSLEWLDRNKDGKLPLVTPIGVTNVPTPIIKSASMAVPDLAASGFVVGAGAFTLGETALRSPSKVPSVIVTEGAQAAGGIINFGVNDPVRFVSGAVVGDLALRGAASTSNLPKLTKAAPENFYVKTKMPVSPEIVKQNPIPITQAEHVASGFGVDNFKFTEVQSQVAILEKPAKTVDVLTGKVENGMVDVYVKVDKAQAQSLSQKLTGNVENVNIKGKSSIVFEPTDVLTKKTYPASESPRIATRDNPLLSDGKTKSVGKSGGNSYRLEKKLNLDDNKITLRENDILQLPESTQTFETAMRKSSKSSSTLEIDTGGDYLLTEGKSPKPVQTKTTHYDSNLNVVEAPVVVDTAKLNKLINTSEPSIISEVKQTPSSIKLEPLKSSYEPLPSLERSSPSVVTKTTFKFDTRDYSYSNIKFEPVKPLESMKGVEAATKDVYVERFEQRRAQYLKDTEMFRVNRYDDFTHAPQLERIQKAKPAPTKLKDRNAFQEEFDRLLNGEIKVDNFEKSIGKTKSSSVVENISKVEDVVKFNTGKDVYVERFEQRRAQYLRERDKNPFVNQKHYSNSNMFSGESTVPQIKPVETTGKKPAYIVNIDNKRKNKRDTDLFPVPAPNPATKTDHYPVPRPNPQPVPSPDPYPTRPNPLTTGGGGGGGGGSIRIKTGKPKYPLYIVKKKSEDFDTGRRVKGGWKYNRRYNKFGDIWKLK